MTEQDRAHGTAPPAEPAGPPTPVPPQRPVPDLGFFAGAPQPREGGFGGPAPATGGQFGTFGAAAAPPSQFGGAATPTAGGQFGTFGAAPAPAGQFGQFGAPASPFGAPAAPVLLGPPPGARPGPQGPLATLRATPGGRWALRVGAGLAVAAVLGMLGIGRFAFLDLFGKDVAAPSSLGGLAPAADQSQVAQLDQQISAYGDPLGLDFEVAVYGDATAPIFFVGATYDEGTPNSEEVAEVLGASGGVNTRLVGENACTQLERGLVVMCARVDDGVMVAVLTANRSMEDTAAITDEAWDAQ